MKKIPVSTLIIAFVVAGVFACFAFAFQVRFNEKVVKLRMGRATAESVITRPGLHFRWPWPIEKIERYDGRLRVLETPEGEIKTTDGKSVLIGAYAVWQIEDALRFYEASGGNELDAINQMRARLNQIRQGVVGRHPMTAFVNLDAEALDESYRKLEAELMAEAQPQLEQAYGVNLVAFKLRRPSLPPTTTETVFDQMRKERERLATQIKTEGDSAKQSIEAQAQADADKIMAFARKRAQEIASEGVQASTRILQQIEETDKEFFAWLRWLEAMQAALEQRTTFFIDTDSPMYDVLMRPEVPRTQPAPVPDAAEDDE